jgi:hypothetical protein
MAEHRKRHCWECRQRSLVCDATEPACKRCSKSGIDCPGYGAVKPTRLKWLAPGRVTSRRRRRNGVLSDEIEIKYSQMEAKTTTELAWPMADDQFAIPRFTLKTEACALVQAVGYCK